MLGLVVDGTGKNVTKVQRQAGMLRNSGYDVGMIFVNTPLDVALERNRKRERQVPEELVKKMWQSVQQNMGAFQRIFGPGNFFIVDSKKTLEGHEEKVFGTAMRRMGMGWLKKPVQNPVGKEVVSRLKATGGKTLGDLAGATMIAASRHYDYLDKSVLEDW